MVKNKFIAEINLDGGILCLDFVNSINSRTAASQVDYFQTLHDFIDWAERLEIVDDKMAGELHAKADKDSESSTVFLQEVIDFRELLYVIFRCIILKEKVPSIDLNRFNKVLSGYFRFLQIEENADGFKESWNIETDSFQRLLAPIVKDSYETILARNHDRIKECPNCGWLFYDTTKNGKRRWCSMKSCGSNIKSLEWYHRNKGKMAPR
jgi:predicted RNA-binding Zn ribbon-like protein